jgi:hypothetical protein
MKSQTDILLTIILAVLLMQMLAPAVRGWYRRSLLVANLHTIPKVSAYRVKRFFKRRFKK